MHFLTTKRCPRSHPTATMHRTTPDPEPEPYGITLCTMTIPCPACNTSLRAYPHPSAPRVLAPCGHSVCWECAEAVLQTPRPVCPVCEIPITASERNMALGGMAEDGFLVFAGCGKRDGEPSAKRARPCHCSYEPCACPNFGARLAESDVPRRCRVHPGHVRNVWCATDGCVVCAVCAEGTHAGHDIHTLDAGCPPVLQARADKTWKRCFASAQVCFDARAAVGATAGALATNKDSAIAEVKRASVKLVQAVVAMEESVIHTITRDYEARMKRLQRQAESLAVSEQQLQCATVTLQAITSIVRAPPTPLALANTCEDALRTAALCTSVVTEPCERPELEARMDTKRVLLAVSGMTTLVVGNSEALAQQAREATVPEAEVAACEAAAAARSQLPHKVSLAWFHGSAAMAGVPEATRIRFVTALFLRWLPRGKRLGPCLYDSGVNALTPREFHAACDRKGPTVVLIRSNGPVPDVFGMFTTTSWGRGRKYWVPSPGAFAFAVMSPYADEDVVKYDIDETISTEPSEGPCFGANSISVIASVDGVLCDVHRDFPGLKCPDLLVTPLEHLEVYAVV